MHEERTDSRRLGRGIQASIYIAFHLVAAVERPAAAPTASRDWRPLCFDDVVRTIRNELCVNTEDVGKGRLDLCRAVEARAETAYRLGDECLESGHVVRRSETKVRHRVDASSVRE
jgi:hypothetical protein